MRSIVFDAGPIISLATNNLLFLLEDLKKRYKGKFYIPHAVKREVVDRPLESKKYKFEALQVLKLIEDDVIEVIHNNIIHNKAIELLQLANSCFKAKEHLINIIHFGEAEGMASSIILNSDAFVIDERTNRLMIEDPNSLVELWKNTLQTDIYVDKPKLLEFRRLTEKIRSIRSVELVTIAYEVGLLDKFILDIPNPRQVLLEGLLWGVKINGCTVSRREIEQILKLEIKK